LEDASKYYYNKELKYITDRELISLFLIRYPYIEIEKEYIEEIIDKILYEYGR
jgi:hypothetical protein